MPNPHQLHEEKIGAIEEKLELSEQKLAQHAKLQPDMEEQLKARMEALTKVGNKVCTRTNMRAGQVPYDNYQQLLSRTTSTLFYVMLFSFAYFPQQETTTNNLNNKSFSMYYTFYVSLCTAPELNTLTHPKPNQNQTKTPLYTNYL